MRWVCLGATYDWCKSQPWSGRRTVTDLRSCTRSAMDPDISYAVAVAPCARADRRRRAGPQRPRLACRLPRIRSPSGIGDCPLPIDDIAPDRTAEIATAVNMVPTQRHAPASAPSRRVGGGLTVLTSIGQTCCPSAASVGWIRMCPTPVFRHAERTRRRFVLPARGPTRRAERNTTVGQGKGPSVRLRCTHPASYARGIRRG